MLLPGTLHSAAPAVINEEVSFEGEPARHSVHYGSIHTGTQHNLRPAL